MAGTAQRQGAPGRVVGADGGPDPDTLHATQAHVLAPASHATSETNDTVPTAADHPSEDRQSAQITPTQFVHQGVAALDAPALAFDSAQAAPLQSGKIRRFTGEKRDKRVGPCCFSTPDHTELKSAAERHGYQGSVSGFIADIALAFITGRFAANLPLSEERRELQEFRARVLRELNRVGINVNQIARALNTDRTPPDIRTNLNELQRLLTYIAEALRHPADPEGA